MKNRIRNVSSFYFILYISVIIALKKKKLYKILEACPKNIKICYPGLNDRRQQKNKTKVKGLKA
jgi:hypothetical protein